VTATRTPPGPNLAVLQYNCGNTDYKPARPFFDRLGPDVHHIIAVQEPYCNARTGATYCHPGYHLAYLGPRRSALERNQSPGLRLKKIFFDAPRFRQAVWLKLESRQGLWPETGEATTQPGQEDIDAAVRDVQSATLDALTAHGPSPLGTRGTRGLRHVPISCACPGWHGGTTQLVTTRLTRLNTKHSGTSSKSSCGGKVRTPGGAS
jgi:hypothetical protein